MAKLCVSPCTPDGRHQGETSTLHHRSGRRPSSHFLAAVVHNVHDQTWPQTIYAPAQSHPGRSPCQSRYEAHPAPLYVARNSKRVLQVVSQGLPRERGDGNTLTAGQTLSSSGIRPKMAHICLNTRHLAQAKQSGGGAQPVQVATSGRPGSVIGCTDREAAQYVLASVPVFAVPWLLCVQIL